MNKRVKLLPVALIGLASAVGYVATSKQAARPDIQAALAVSRDVGQAPKIVATRIGALEFTHDFANGFPTPATVNKLYDEIDFQRAC